MPTGTAPAESFAFGPYRLEIATRSLFRAGEFIALPPKAAETLLALLEEAGRVVTKEALLERVWPGVVVEEGGIANNVSALRKILDADFGEDGPIATVARRGYRFTASVTRSDGLAVSPAAAPAIGAGPAPARKAAPISDRDTILVADIENQTGDPVFDGTLKQALTLHLAQSPFLELVSDRKVHTVLGTMGRPGEAVLGDVALEICQRTGARAAITGSIFAVGEHFVVGLFAVRSDNGDILVTEQARAASRSEVLAALDHAALGLREKLGESLASVKKHSARFDEVATSSLEALKAYTTGRDTLHGRGEMAAIPHQLRAIALDPNFVSAHSALAIIFNNMGQTSRAAEHMKKAYELRERATERERYRIEGSYHEILTGDLNKSLEASQASALLYPRDSAQPNNCGSLLNILGQYEKAEAILRVSAGLEHSGITLNNLANALLAQERVDEAGAVVDEAFGHGYTAFFHHSDAYLVAFLRGDIAAMKRHLDAVAGREGEEDYLVAIQSATEAFHGRMERSREIARRAADLALRANAAEVAATWLAESAYRDLLVGNAERARQVSEAALATAGGKNVVGYAGITLARCGHPERAEALASELDRQHPQSTIAQRYWIPCIRASIALAQSNAKAALAALDATTGIEMGLIPPFPTPPLCPPWLRAEAHAIAGRWEEVLQELAKITSRPGLARNSLLFPLAHLHSAKALAALGRHEEADAMRYRFDEMWKTADAPVKAAVTG